MQNKENNLINFENEIKFQESKKKDDPFNINNIDIESIVFHDEKKSSSSSPCRKNEEDKFNIFNNFPSSTNVDDGSRSSPKKEAPVKNDFDLGSLGLDFGNSSNTGNSTNTASKSANDSKNDLHNFAKEILLFDLPPLQVDPVTLDNFTIREICDPLINVSLNLSFSTGLA